MNGGLRELLGLPAIDPPSGKGANGEFGQTFRDGMAGLNQDMQFLAAQGGRADHQKLDSQRLNLIAAYQTASASGNGDANQRIIAAIGKAKETVASKAAGVMAGRDAWQKREPDFDGALVKIGELEDAGHSQATAFRQISVEILNRANGRDYRQASAALDQLLPKLDQAHVFAFESIDDDDWRSGHGQRHETPSSGGGNTGSGKPANPSKGPDTQYTPPAKGPAQRPQDAPPPRPDWMLDKREIQVKTSRGQEKMTVGEYRRRYYAAEKWVSEQLLAEPPQGSRSHDHASLNQEAARRFGLDSGWKNINNPHMHAVALDAPLPPTAPPKSGAPTTDGGGGGSSSVGGNRTNSGQTGGSGNGGSSGTPPTSGGGNAPAQPIARQKALPNADMRKGSVMARRDIERHHNNPKGVWDQQYLKNNPKIQKVLDEFADSKSPTGKSVKNLNLNGMTADEIRKELTSRGFKHHPEVLGSGAPHDIYTHADGGMVRVKPEGDPTSKHRPEPHVSKSVLVDPARGTGFPNEAFKVTNEGQAVPKSPEASAGMKQTPRSVPQVTSNRKIPLLIVDEHGKVIGKEGEVTINKKKEILDKNGKVIGKGGRKVPLQSHEKGATADQGWAIKPSQKSTTTPAADSVGPTADDQGKGYTATEANRAHTNLPPKSPPRPTTSSGNSGGGGTTSTATAPKNSSKTNPTTPSAPSDPKTTTASHPPSKPNPTSPRTSPAAPTASGGSMTSPTSGTAPKTPAPEAPAVSKTGTASQGRVSVNYDFSGDNKSVTIKQINLSDYPPDKPGKITGFFSDRPMLSGLAKAGTNFGANYVSDKALEKIQEHYGKAVHEAEKVFLENYPTPKKLRDDARLDEHKETYRQVMEYVGDVGNAGRIAGKSDEGLLINLEGAFAYENALVDLATKAELMTAGLWEIAEDIHKRSEVLGNIGQNFEEVFKWIHSTIVGTAIPYMYYQSFTFWQLRGVFKSLSARLGNFAGMIKTRHNEYKELSNKLGDTLVQVNGELDPWRDMYEKRKH